MGWKWDLSPRVRGSGTEAVTFTHLAGLSPRVREPAGSMLSPRRLAVVDLDVESHVLVFRLPPGRLGNPLSR